MSIFLIYSKKQQQQQRTMPFSSALYTILLVLFVQCSYHTCVASHAVVQNNKNNNGDINYDRSQQHHQQQEQFNERILQNNATYCSVIYNKFVYSDSSYERSNSPCDCIRSSERLIETVDIDPVVIKRTIPGSFQVDCSYDYCTANNCMMPNDGSNIKICASRTTNSSYKEDVDTPNDTQLMEGRECVLYTSDDVSMEPTNVCKRIYYDFNLDLACEIQLGSADSVFNEKCTSCKFVSCDNNDGTTTSTNFWQRKVAFDCTNINGLYAMDACNNTGNRFVHAPDQTIWKFDPLSWINPFGLIQFDTCFDANAPKLTTPPSPINGIQPTNKPSKKPSSTSTSSTTTTTTNSTKPKNNTTKTTATTNATTTDIVTSNGFQSITSSIQLQSYFTVIALTSYLLYQSLSIS